MAASSVEKLHEEVTCPICLSFFREPVTLPCGHNFCRACIAPVTPPLCPECRLPLGDTSALRPNRQLQNVVEIARDFRLSWRKLSELSLCGEHTEQLRLFCETDMQPICVVCCMGAKHASHTVLPIEEAAHTYKRVLQKALGPVKKELEDLVELEKMEAALASNLMEQAEAQPREITSEFERLHCFLDEEKDRLLSRLTEECKSLKETIDGKMSKLSEKRKDLQSLIDEVEEKCQQPAPDLLMDLKSTLSRCEDAKITIAVSRFALLKRTSLDSCPRYSALKRLSEDFQGPAFKMQEDCNIHSTARKVVFDEILQRLQMTPYTAAKLSLKDIQQICTDCLENCQSQRVEDVPWHFLRKLMALNIRARSSGVAHAARLGACDNRSSVNPLDVLCVLLHCSDGLLQQEVLQKMAMCQFALPLLLPSSDSFKCTFLLWALRDIVKNWRPHSMREGEGLKHERLVVTPMPIVSFVRLGTCSLSKSNILNKLLSHPQHHDIFVHQDMDSGNFPRKISNGLVEIAWYFPSGAQTDLFPEPITVANLRGDLEFHRPQFNFLTEVSSAIFIFTDCAVDKEPTLLQLVKDLKSKIFFIINDQISKPSLIRLLVGLQTPQRFNPSNILQRNRLENDTQFVNRLRSAIGDVMKQSPSRVTLETMAVAVCKIGACVDEDFEDCQIAKGLCQKISEVEEMIKNSRRVSGPWDKMSIRASLFVSLERRQNVLSEGIKQCLEGLKQSTKEQRRYLMKWMKFCQDSRSRNQLMASWSSSSFLQHMSDFYFQFFHSKGPRDVELCHMAADVLLDGFALELTDANFTDINLHWISEVFGALDLKLGRSMRLAVITVLGMQHTGKSTLLNTMFSLQFPISSGRCAQGALISILKVSENLSNKLGCDLLLVIDTEALNGIETPTDKARTKQKDGLAALVIGLSDIVLISLPPENAAERSRVLQIVVDACLATKTVGKKPSCQFMHMNVSDHVQKERQRKYLQEELFRTTSAAAQREKHDHVTEYSDIMEYNPERDNWHIPVLWHGAPPMAQVNVGYSEKVCELRRHLLDIVKHRSQQKPQKDLLSFPRDFQMLLSKYIFA